MKLTAKFALLALFIVALVIADGVLTVTRANITQQQARVLQSDNAIRRAVTDMETAFYGYDDQLNMYVMVANSTNQAALRATTYRQASRFDAVLNAELADALSGASTASPIHRLLRRLAVLVHAYEHEAGQVHRDVLQHHGSAAEALQTVGNVHTSNAIMVLLPRIGRASDSLVDRGTLAIQRAQNNLITTAWVANIVMVVVLASVLIYVQRRGVRPLHMLERAARNVSEGVVIDPIDYRSSDEIGRLVQAFQRVVHYLDGMRQAAAAIGEGDLARIPRAVGPHDTLGLALIQLHRHLQTLVESLRHANDQVRTQAEELQQQNHTIQRLAGNMEVILNAMDVGVVQGNPQDGITFANPAALRILGYHAADDVLGQPLDAVCHGSASDDLSPPAARRPGLETLRESTWHRQDETTMAVEYRVIPLSPTSPNSARLVTFQDITDRKAMEAELIRSQKLESIGLMAGGIAHDFNNSLTVVLGAISLMQDQGASSDLLSIAEAACTQASHLAQKLLTFAKGADPVTQPVNLGDLLRESVALALTGASVQCQIQPQTGTWPVEADPGQLRQVVQNLLLNAAQAMPHGGIIRVGTDNIMIDPGAGLPLMPGAYVALTIQDHGMGIAAQDLPHIFDPYFSTKSEGHGLGLYITYAIVKKHRGHIAVSSTKGHGTQVIVYLPAAAVEPDRAVVGPDSGLVYRTDPILLMDDQPLVRQVAAEMLDRLGYQVTVVDNGDQALALCQDALQRGHPFRAAILDLTLPGTMGGAHVGRILRQYQPDLTIILSSGYSSDGALAQFREWGFQGVLIKPYTIKKLSEVVHQALSSQGES